MFLGSGRSRHFQWIYGDKGRHTKWCCEETPVHIPSPTNSQWLVYFIHDNVTIQPCDGLYLYYIMILKRVNLNITMTEVGTGEDCLMCRAVRWRGIWRESLRASGGQEVNDRVLEEVEAERLSVTHDVFSLIVVLYCAALNVKVTKIVRYWWGKCLQSIFYFL